MSNWKFKAYNISSQNEIRGNTIIGRTYISSQGVICDWISSNTGGGGGGSSTFTDLTDTPSSYTDKSGQFAVVSPTEDGLVFRRIVCTLDNVVVVSGNVVLV